MFRIALRRFGIIKATVGLTFITIMLSLGIPWLALVLLHDDSKLEGLLIATLAPAIITPMLSLRVLHLLRQLDKAEQQLQILSNTGELTQTYNRRYFMQCSDQELKRAQRYGETFSIAILDLANFKNINNIGYLTGDQVLRKLSSWVKDQICQVDIFARYGGNEFSFLFPRTNRE